MKEIKYAQKEEEKRESFALYGYQAFVEAVEAFLQENRDGQYCLIAIDVEHFKLFNELYGFEAGDKLLAQLTRILQDMKCLAGHMGGDDFAILMPDDEKEIFQLKKRLDQAIHQQGRDLGFFSYLGVYPIEERKLSVPAMYDRAVLAVSKIKGNYTCGIYRYDSRLKDKLEQEHYWLDSILKALKKKEFTFYLQPQVSIVTGKIVSFEALVRWENAENGVMSPANFIPILERNGLITRLDLYIWESVVAFLSERLKEKKRLLPISVNVSRVDIYALDIVEVFTELTQKYGVNPKYVEIEITESAYAEDSKKISEIVENLREAGFIVLMDDFGSGYSSLNMLKDVNVDILKIDMRFLQMEESDQDKTVGILEAIVRMARLLGLRIIAEGIENQKQVDYLLKIGCRYGQGYFYAKPMPNAQAVELVQEDEKCDYAGIQFKESEELMAEELLHSGIAGDWMLDNVLGGIAFYTKSEEKGIELLRANDKYYRTIRTDSKNVIGKHRNIIQRIYEEDKACFTQMFETALELQSEGAEGDIRYVREDGLVIWLHLRLYCLKAEKDHALFFGAISTLKDIQKRITAREAQQVQVTDVIAISDKELMERFMRQMPAGVVGGYLEDNIPVYIVNDTILQWMGYTYDEFIKAVNGSLINMIHPDEREEVIKYILGELDRRARYIVQYRVCKKDGTYLWVKDMGKTILAEDGRKACLSILFDISEDIEVQEKLEKVALTDTLTGLHNRRAGEAWIEKFFLEKRLQPGLEYQAGMFDLDLFKNVNDMYGHRIGDEMLQFFANKLQEIFGGNMIFRLGGDEFFIFIYPGYDKAALERMIKTLNKAYCEEVARKCPKSRSSVSTGFLCTSREESFEQLYGLADAELYQVKSEQRGTYQILTLPND